MPRMFIIVTIYWQA